ncbi:MAG: DUF4136 domain-containing protein [Halioglobus sp.]
MKSPRHLLATTLLIALATCLGACSGIDIDSSDVQPFADGNYRYYKWRTDPLPRDTRSTDPYYLLDPIMRREVDEVLAAKGFILDPERAQFSVDYVYATVLVDGAQSEQASNISPIPSVTPNRRIDGASVDNAIALGGVKETNNILIQFNDLESHKEVWRVVISKIVEDVNQVVSPQMEANVDAAVRRALSPLPAAGTPTD